MGNCYWKDLNKERAQTALVMCKESIRWRSIVCLTIRWDKQSKLSLSCDIFCLEFLWHHTESHHNNTICQKLLFDSSPPSSSLPIQTVENLNWTKVFFIKKINYRTVSGKKKDLLNWKINLRCTCHTIGKIFFPRFCQYRQIEPRGCDQIFCWNGRKLQLRSTLGQTKRPD